jgi:hypothetical protein
MRTQQLCPGRQRPLKRLAAFANISSELLIKTKYKNMKALDLSSDQANFQALSTKRFILDYLFLKDSRLFSVIICHGYRPS